MVSIIPFANSFLSFFCFQLLSWTVGDLNGIRLALPSGKHHLVCMCLFLERTAYQTLSSICPRGQISLWLFALKEFFWHLSLKRDFRFIAFFVHLSYETGRILATDSPSLLFLASKGIFSFEIKLPRPL